MWWWLILVLYTKVCFLHDLDRKRRLLASTHPGKNLLASLNAAGIPTTYILLPSLSVVLPKISLCLLGTHALLSNGSMFSRAGTAMVAMMLKERGVPVVCCCETYKFSERIMLDSIVGNEMGTFPFPYLLGRHCILTPYYLTFKQLPLYHSSKDCLRKLRTFLLSIYCTT